MEFSRNPTSNDLLLRLAQKHSHDHLNYTVIAQSVEEVQDVENSPSVSMGPYLISSDLTRLLTTLSIYSLRGNSREQVRLLYMNGTALRIWKEMGKQSIPLGRLNRPPNAALHAYGVPFSK